MASSPKVHTPDPANTARAQGVANVKTAETQARLNRLDETTPLGTVRYNPVFDQAGFDEANFRYLQERNKIANEIGQQQAMISDTDLARAVNNSDFIKALIAEIGVNTNGQLEQQLKKRGFELPQTKDFERFERVTELNPTASQTFDAQQQLGLQLAGLAQDQFGRVGEAMGEEFTFDGLPVLPAADADARNRIEDALFQRQAGRLDDRFSDQRRALETRLANQGIQRGTELFDRELFNFRKAQNDAYDIAQMNAIAGAAQEQNRLFNMGSAARSQALRERLMARQIPLNELSAARSGSQVQIPDFGPTSPVGVAPTNLIGAVNAAQQSQLQNAANIAGARNATTSGLFNLAGAGLGAAGTVAATPAVAGALAAMI